MRKRLFFCLGGFYALAEWAYATGLVARDAFCVRWLHHLRRLTAESGSELFHGHLVVRRNDDAHRLAVDESHKSFEHAPGLTTFSGLKADASGRRIIVVVMDGEVDACSSSIFVARVVFAISWVLIACSSVLANSIQR